MTDKNLINKNFKLLAKGLMQPCYRTTYEAYKELYKIGQPIVPILSDKILETDARFVLI